MSEIHTRRGYFTPATVSEDSRTVTVSWGTGAPVLRQRGAFTFLEELDMSEGAVDLSVLRSNAKLLDSHRADSVLNVLGTVEEAWIQSGEGFARVRFSKRNDVEPIWQDVKDGVLTGVSIGYTVAEWKERNENGMLVKRAVRWAPVELSLVAVPADGTARVRGHHSAEAIEMSETNNTAVADVEVRRAEAVTENRVESAADCDAARVAEIEAAYRSAVSIVGEDVAGKLRDSAIALGQSAEAYRSAVWKVMVEQSRNVARPMPRATVGVGASNDDPAVVRERLATALAVRMCDAAAQRAGDSGWQRYRDIVSRPSAILAELAAARGERDAWRNRDDLIYRAFHTTSDFPELLAAAANKALEASYAAAQPTYRVVFARRRFNDFKPHRFITLGDWPSLRRIGEGGEIERGTISEKRETVTPATYGRSIAVTRQMLMNDDLGAFADMVNMISRSVNNFEDATAFALVNENNGEGPLLTEGNARVFATARGNRAATGTAITVTTLAAARAAVMKQTTLDGLPIAIGNTMLLLVGPDKELEARQLTATINPAQTSSVNPYAGFIETVVSPYIPGNRWYLFATETRPYVYGFVSEREAPQVRSYGQIPGADGVQIDVVHDFGVGAIDFRGAYFNPGA